MFFLQPVYDLLFDDFFDGLNLPRSSVRVCYKAYHNTYKGIQLRPNDLSLDDAVNQKLTPVGAININGGVHTLVLDTVEKITRENQSDGYNIGDVRLIFKNTHDDEENDQPKKYTINANSERAPDVFYFVHINVDFDQIQDNTSDSETSSSSESSEDDSACNGC